MCYQSQGAEGEGEGAEEGQMILEEVLKILLTIDRTQSHEGLLEGRFHPGYSMSPL